MSGSILILITGDPVPSAHAQYGDFGTLIQKASAGSWDDGFEAIDLRTTSELPAATNWSAVIISGSPARIEERSDWMQRGFEFLREAVRAATPTFGICFGHQMLAEALGGRVARNPNGREIGTVAVDLVESNPIFDAAPPAYANATHVDSIVELPRGASAVARTELEPNAVVRFTEVVWGVQFHPEIDAAVLDCYLSERSDALLAEGLDPAALRRTANDAPSGRSALQNFLRRVARPV